MIPSPLSALSVIVLSGALLAVIVAFIAYRQRPDPMALPVTFVMVSTTVWSVAAAIVFSAGNLDIAVFAEQLRLIGTVLVPLAFFVLATSYAGLERWRRPGLLVLVGVVPAVTVVVTVTNPLHGMLFENPALASVVGGTMIETDPGPWFAVHVAWAYGVMIVSLGILAWEIRRVDPFNRRQPVALLLGGLFPLSTSMLHNANLEILGPVDLTPISLAVSGVLFALALFRFDLVKIGPIARERVLEDIPDGVIVVDSSGTIREFNKVAATMLDGVARGRAANEVLPQEFAESGGELTIDDDGDTRQFRYDRQPFHDNHGREFGELVYLRDVTAIVRREQRISVLNRVLRHNIRNELTIQLGHLELLRDEPSTPKHHFDTIEASIKRVQGFADQARLVDRTLRNPGTIQRLRLGPVVEDAAASVTGDFPDASIEVAGANEITHVETIDRELLRWVVAELIENAVVHGGDTGQSVTVDITERDTLVEIAILDDGPGIPADEIAAIEATVETALEHGSGFGLWLARWTAERSEGELSFAERDGRNAVCLLLQQSE